MAKCDCISAGNRKHKIVVKLQQSVPNGSGGQIITWPTRSSPFASARVMSGQEILARFGLVNTYMVEFGLLYQDGKNIMESDKIAFEDKDYNIISKIDVDFEKLVIKIVAQSGVVQ